MQITAEVCTVQQLGEQAHAIRIDLVNHDGQAAVVPFLVILDQLSSQVTRLMLGTPERRETGIYLPAVRRR